MCACVCVCEGELYTLNIFKMLHKSSVCDRLVFLGGVSEGYVVVPEVSKSIKDTPEFGAYATLETKLEH